MLEVNLAKKVISWLEDYGWNVYQEVKIHSPVADIVAIQNNLVWIIEVKNSLGLKVIDQAVKWGCYSHYVSVATPDRFQNRELVKEILEWKGIGSLVIDNYGEIYEDIKPSINRKAYTKDVLKSLREEQKTFSPAGSKGGGYYTPFKDTCQKIRKAIENNPGITLNELLSKVKTHYRTPASARQNILYWGKQNILIGIKVEKEGKQYKFYLT